MKTMTIKQLMDFLKKSGWERTQKILPLGQYGSEIHGVASKTSVLDGVTVTCEESFSFDANIGALNTGLDGDGIKFRFVISGVDVYRDFERLTRNMVSEIIEYTIFYASDVDGDAFLEIDYSEFEKKHKKS